MQLRLPDSAADALAELVPMLGCGEEAAALAFDGLAATLPGLRTTLRRIADEERVHDSLLKGLQDALPATRRNPPRELRRLHVQLASGSALIHCAQIAALDSAVCIILARLIRRAAPLTKDAGLVALICRIRRDEARHVCVTRQAILEAPTRALREVAAATRAAFADALKPAGAAFELLGVDPDALFARVAQLPAKFLLR